MKISIPDKLDILGHRYAVIKENRLDSGANNPGSCSTKNCKIWIDTSQSVSQQETSLLHEIIEALDYHLSLHLEHDKIMQLEAGLYQVLKTNDLL